MVNTEGLVGEARSLGLFKAHAPFEVHCEHCAGRLDGHGDCPTCGLIGRPESEITKRLQVDPAGTAKLLETQIARRKAYRPSGREAKSQDR